MQNCYLPIQTLCLISTTGDVRPVWFRYEDELHQIIKVKIAEILSYKEIKTAGKRELIYTCTATDGENMNIFDLKYTLETHKWILYRKVM